MKSKIFQLFLILIVITSCDDKSKKNTPDVQDVLNETPEVLEENSSFKISSYSGRYDSDIISKLYAEAIEKNSKLEKLNDEINQMKETKNDSLSEYSIFSRINASYYSNSKVYANRIQDSVLKEETLEFIKTIESKYLRKMENHVEKQLMIDQKSISLDDQLILMKLFVTESMISNYQHNEKPDIKTLENIIKKYDSLIKATEEYTKIRK